MNPEVEYYISLHASRFFAYQSKRNSRNGNPIAKITNFIWLYHWSDFEEFVDQLIFYQICERVCLELAFNHIRLKNKCKKFERNGNLGCIVHHTAVQIYNLQKNTTGD